jgi:hypothetical protein
MIKEKCQRLLAAMNNGAAESFAQLPHSVQLEAQGLRTAGLAKIALRVVADDLAAGRITPKVAKRVAAKANKVLQTGGGE